MLKIEDLCVNLHPNWKKVRKMKQFKILFILSITIMLMASCLSGSDDTVTLYSDAAITGFTLGTLNKYDGDTKTTFTASTYHFNVDQSNTGVHVFKDTTIIGRCVFNTDSLPLGTDLKHVVGTLTTLNNGVAIIEQLDNPDYYDYFSSLDSIDFTKPRKILVYSSDGSAYNQYYISVDAHQEDGNKFVWKQMGPEYGMVGTDVTTYYSDGSRLIGQSTTEMYRLTTDRRIEASRDGGQTWKTETLDEDASMLPVQDIAIISYPMSNADSIDYVLMVGNREVSEQNNESIAMVWRKVVDYGKNAPKASWSYMERNAGSDSLALPRLQNLRIVKYDDGILAIGGAGIGGCTAEPYTQIYQSRDNGLTWKYNPHYQFPEGFDTSSTYVQMLTNDDNFLWLFCQGTGQVWRGRLNKMGWKNMK